MAELGLSSKPDDAPGAYRPIRFDPNYVTYVFKLLALRQLKNKMREVEKECLTKQLSYLSLASGLLVLSRF